MLDIINAFLDIIYTILTNPVSRAVVIVVILLNMLAGTYFLIKKI